MTRHPSDPTITGSPVRPPSSAVDGLNRPPAGDATRDGLCALHGREPIPPDTHRVCGECGHAYATADELIEADYAIRRDLAAADGLAELIERRDPDLIHICPLCTHNL